MEEPREIPAIVLEPEELQLLVNYWHRAAWQIRADGILLGCASGSGCRRLAFANRRLNTAAEALGMEEFETAVEKAWDNLEKENPRWKALRDGDTKEINAWRNEIDRDMYRDESS